MARWSKDDLARYLERTKGNPPRQRPLPAPRIEPVVPDVALGTARGEEEGPRRFRIRLVRVAKRLLDEDNICNKALVDCVRRSGYMTDDSPDLCEIIQAQRKCRKGEAPHTEILLEELIP